MNDITKETPFYIVVSEIVALWTLANIGYYALLPLFGIDISYNASPIIISAYLFFWSGISIYNFWDLYTKWFKISSKIWWYTLLSLGLAVIVSVLLYIFSLLPDLKGVVGTAYTDLFFATPLYFLPKAIEILLQQVLIAVLVLELHFNFHTLKNVIIGYIVCFVGAHVALFFLNGASVQYAITMTLGALVSAFVFPYLILRTRGGLIYAYGIHILFYIFLAMLLHVWYPFGYIL